MIDFCQIQYLREGTQRQQQVFAVLTDHFIVDNLQKFDPILVGTIPINVDIESSDLDIICCYTSPGEFMKEVRVWFDMHDDFRLEKKTIAGVGTVLCRFRVDGFKVELFGQMIPTRQQLAYRHMIVEYNILKERGESFRLGVIELKKQGYKTEPAFGMLLGLNGDAYEQLLEYESGRHDG